jgi:thiol-disulfide isomerase/thioredoxin
MKSNAYFYFLIVSLVQISCQKPSIDYDSALKSCVQDTLWKNKEEGKYVLYYSKADCIVDAQLPEFAAEAMDGKLIDKAYLANKISVINFWYTECHPCEAEIPGLNKLVEKYKFSPVNFLAISMNPPNDVEDFLATHPFNFDQIAYGEPIIKANFKSKWGYPMIIVADQNLKIIYAQNGGMNDTLAAEKIQMELIPVIDKALEKK